MPEPITETEESKESQKRIEAFKAESLELSKKYECDLYCFPGFLPNEDGSFKIVTNLQIVDIRKFKQRSPYQMEDLK